MGYCSSAGSNPRKSLLFFHCTGIKKDTFINFELHIVIEVSNNKMYLNGKKTTYEKLISYLEDLSNRGYNFKRLPSYDSKVMLLQAYKSNNELFDYENLEISNCKQLNRIMRPIEPSFCSFAYC